MPAPELQRKGWLDRLKSGLRKTGSSIATVFTGTRIDDALYEELEDALLMADTGVKATQFLLDDLKRRVKEAKATEPSAVKGLLAEALADLLRAHVQELSRTANRISSTRRAASSGRPLNRATSRASQRSRGPRC